MNTKGMKFLAVLAVLAMAFASCAVLTESGQSDAIADVTQDITLAENFSVQLNVGPTGTITGPATGTAFSVGGVFAGATETPAAPWAYDVYKYYAFATLTFSGDAPAYICVKQTNSALSLDLNEKTTADLTDIGKIYKDGTTFGKASTFATASEDTLSILIPQDGSTVTLEIYGDSSAFTGKAGALSVDKLINTVTLDFSKAKTVVALDASNASSIGWSYAAEGKKLTLSADTYKNTIFSGENIAAATTAVTDAMMAAHGLVVKKAGSPNTYFMSVGDAVNSIDVATEGKATPALATASPVSITLIADTEELAGIAMKHSDDYYNSLDHYVALDLNLNGNTIKHTSATGLAGFSSVNKMFDFNANQIVKIYNGTITSELTYADKTNKDVGFAVIGTNGPLTLGDGTSGLTIDISKVRMAIPEDTSISEKNYAVGVWAASGITTIKSGVTINAGEHFATIASYATSDTIVSGVHVQSINAGTGLAGDATAMSRVVVDGSTLIGDFGTVHWKTGGAATTTGYTNGAEFIVESGSLSGKVIDEARWVNGGKTNETTQDGIKYSLITFNGGTFTDYAALQYVAEGKSVNINAGGKDVPAEEAKEATITSGTVTIDTENLKSGEANTIVMASDAAVTKLEANVSTKDVVIIGKEQALTGVDLTVNGEGSVTLTGFASVSGTITTGTGTTAQSVRLDAAKGTFTFSQGSIVLETEWEGGTIYLKNGQTLKIRGNVAANGSILRDPTDTAAAADYSATVIIEAGEGKALTIADGATLTIGDAGEYTKKIAVEIQGELKANGDLKTGALDVSKAKSLTVKDGGVLATHVTSADATKNIVYGGGDINSATIDDITKWSGKTASGSWTISKSGTGADVANPVAYTLTLNNYEGNYNFAAIPDDGDGPTYTGLKTIDLTGDNVVSIKAPVNVAAGLFGGSYLSSITTNGSGSLTINVDISDVEGADLDAIPSIIKGAALKINGVSIMISVTGTNAEWTVEQTDDMAIKGIETTSLDLFDAPLAISVMPDYDSANIFGISTGTFDVTGNAVLIVAATAVKADDVTIKTAAVEFDGDVDLEGHDITISNASAVDIDGVFNAKAISVSQESEIAIKDAIISGTVQNYGSVLFTGNVMVTSAGAVTNNNIMKNEGVLGIYGEFENKDGTFTNDGKLNVYGMKLKTPTAALSITDAAASANNARLKSISLTEITEEYDGTLSFDATITVYKSLGSAAIAEPFTGVLVPALNGGYTLTMSNTTASIIVTYDPEAEGAADVVGKDYTITVTGSVKAGEDVLYLQANKTASEAATIGADSIKLGGSFQASAADFDVTKGKLVNNDTVIVSSADGALVGSSASYEGNLISNVPATTISGTFTGNLTANGVGLVTVGKFTGDIVSKGSVTVSKDKTMTGNITAKNVVTITGILAGDITTEGDVVINKMNGNVTVNRANTDVTAKTVTVNGESDITLTYNSKYKATKDATEATEYSATMIISGTPSGLVIDLAKGDNATDSKAVVPGYFRITGTGALEENKIANMALTSGKLLVDSAVVLESRYYLTIEAGATIEVNKSAASLDVKKAALKVSKDAIANFETGSAIPVNYGKVLFVMSFAIDGGAYTIYSDVAYALLNCEENQELTVGESAEIDQDVAVKAGVNILVKDVTLTFKGKTIEMADGAKITLEGTGKIMFKASGDNTATAEADVTGETEYVFYTVSATIVYEDNVIVFENARIDTNDKFVTGIAATSTDVAKLSVDLSYNEGLVAIAAGNAIGKMDVNNASYAKTYADKHAEGGEIDTPVCGIFYIADEAVFEANKLEDAPADYELDLQGDLQVNMLPTIITVDGTLKLLDSISVNGIYGGEGTIILAENKTITIEKGYYLDGGDITKGFCAPYFDGTVIDATDAENGYVFSDIVVAPDYLLFVGEPVIIKAEKLSSDNVVSLKGTILQGSIIAVNATTVAVFNDVYVCEDASIVADKVYILDDSVSDGVVMTKELTKKTGKVLAYDVTYTEGEYTAYTTFTSIDFDEISDITIATDLWTDDLTLTDILDLSGKDVNITIAEDATLYIIAPLIIGTPINVLGGSSSIVGKVVIDDATYIVAYSDVNLDDAEIVQEADEKTPAVYSTLTIEDVLYATIFANSATSGLGVKLTEADMSIVPVIAGYNFTKWNNLNGTDSTNAIDEGNAVGLTNAYAGAKAVLISVTVKFAEGVTYYKNGVEFAIYDTPTKVDYGSVFTAKINNTAKYTGTPLINGQNSYIVEDDATLTVSGVTPITPEPTPEPEVGGISLTDILLIVLVILIAVMVVILVLRLNRS